MATSLPDAPPLLRLPVELLEIIGAQLPRRSALACSLLCRGLSGPAQRSLFRRVRFPDGDGSVQLLLFLSTILTRPALGAHVLELEIDEAVSFPGHSATDDIANARLENLAMRIAQLLARAIQFMPSLRRFALYWPPSLLERVPFDINKTGRALQSLVLSFATPEMYDWALQCPHLKHLTVHHDGIPQDMSNITYKRVGADPPSNAIWPKLRTLCADIQVLCNLVPGRSFSAIAMSDFVHIDTILAGGLFNKLAQANRPLQKLSLALALSDLAAFGSGWSILWPLTQAHFSTLQSLTLRIDVPVADAADYETRLKSMLDNIPSEQLPQLATLRVWEEQPCYPHSDPFNSIAIDRRLVRVAAEHCRTLTHVSMPTRVSWYRVPFLLGKSVTGTSNVLGVGPSPYPDDAWVLRGLFTARGPLPPDVTRDVLWTMWPRGHYRSVLKSHIVDEDKRALFCRIMRRSPDLDNESLLDEVWEADPERNGYFNETEDEIDTEYAPSRNCGNSGFSSSSSSGSNSSAGSSRDGDSAMAEQPSLSEELIACVAEDADHPPEGVPVDSWREFVAGRRREVGNLDWVEHWVRHTQLVEQLVDEVASIASS